MAQLQRVGSDLIRTFVKGDMLCGDPQASFHSGAPRSQKGWVGVDLKRHERLIARLILKTQAVCVFLFCFFFFARLFSGGFDYVI